MQESTTSSTVARENLPHVDYLIIDNGEIGSSILLVQDKGKNNPPRWKLPGGKQDNPSDSPLFTVHRKTIDEIGITIETLEEVFRLIVDDPTPHLFIAFAGYAPDARLDRLVLNYEEIAHVAFFDERQIKDLIREKLILPRHAQAIEEYWRQHCY